MKTTHSLPSALKETEVHVLISVYCLPHSDNQYSQIIHIVNRYCYQSDYWYMSISHTILHTLALQCQILQKPFKFASGHALFSYRLHCKNILVQVKRGLQSPKFSLVRLSYVSCQNWLCPTKMVWSRKLTEFSYATCCMCMV